MAQTTSKTAVQRNHKTIDAAHKSLGRIATQASILLQGKNKTQYDHSRDAGDFVRIINIKDVKFTGKKFVQKKYHRHSGYPGGIKERTLQEMFNANPAKVVRYTVEHMLPNNRLRKGMLKRLTIE